MIFGAWLCLLAPLAGALAITLLGTRISRRGAGYLATGSVLVAFLGALISFLRMWAAAPDNRSHGSTAWNWLTAGSFDFGLRILADPLSVFMMLVIAGVGMLIVAYSIGYMEDDEEERRYFAYMALFVFSMLLLVEAGNLLILLAGWGMVGLCSYLLIGFWHERPSAIAAAKKAFVMNAFGDATMALALFLLILHTHTLDFPGVFRLHASHTVLDLVALGLLGGAVAKSAQIPLHTWLPDAMEGPTPVSALIHAATMVTAGVYLIVRTHALFELAPRVQELAAGLGALTLVVAGLIALVQTDIKRVIAYSTMSQIGYMFLAVGLGAYPNGMFHLMTHAFFKALLFMAAGVVIHALAGEQDIRKMGGLWKLMPWTGFATVVGALALAGIPPFAGFFSKDSILAAALDRGWYGDVLWAAGMVGVFLTAVYAFRLVFIVFGGEPSAFVREHLVGAGHAAGVEGRHEDPSEDDASRPHGHTTHEDGGEGPLSMTAPVAILAFLSLVGGWIQFAGAWTPVSSWLEPVARPIAEASGRQEAFSTAASVALAFLGIAFAWAIYGVRRRSPIRQRALQTLLERKFYFDEVYEALFYRPAVGLTRALRGLVERPVVEGSVTGVALGTRGLGLGTGRLQTGLVRSYALAIAASLAVLVVVFVAVR